MKKLPLILVLLSGLDALLVGEGARAAAFKLGFEDCPSSAQGLAGEIKDYDITLTLTSDVTESNEGAQGWSFGVTVSGGAIVEHDPGQLDGLQLEGVVVSTIFTRVNQSPVDPSPFDLGNSSTRIIQTIPPGAQEATGAVCAVLLSSEAGMNRTLHPQGTQPIGKLKVRAVCPSVVTLSYTEGLQGSGQPMALVVSLNGTSFTPSVDACCWELSENQEDHQFINLALSGVARQSSDNSWPGVGTNKASRAIDGNTDGDWWHGSVTHTSVGDPDPWWEVSLAATSPLSRIVLWNRTDCCSDRLSNFRVSVLDDSRREVFAQSYFADGRGTFPERFSIDLPDGTSGRVVRISVGPNSSDLRILALAEVEVLTAATTRNGDVNGDQGVDISDAIYLLQALFQGGPKPVPFADRGQLQHAQRFHEKCGGVVIDDETGLMWQKDASPELRAWQEAIDYCENLRLGGYDDWRLPQVWELQRIIDYGRPDQAIDPLFTGASTHCWSSTSLAGTPQMAWYVVGGWVQTLPQDRKITVRAVRRGL